MYKKSEDECGVSPIITSGEYITKENDSDHESVLLKANHKKKKRKDMHNLLLLLT